MKFTYRQFRSLIREAMLNAYKVLGIDRNATPEDIKTAWRTLAIKNHPDRAGGDLEKMKDINAARDILNTPRLKNKLDYELGSRQYAPPPYQQRGTGYGSQPGYGDRERAERQADRQHAERNRQSAQQASPSSNRSFRRFEYINIYERSKKFWEVNVDGNTMNVKWGRIGSQGQSKAKTYSDGLTAQVEARKLIQQKLDKGYKETTRGEAGAAKTPPPRPQEKQPEPTPSTSTKAQGKKTYKVYGRMMDPKSAEGGSGVHTRVKNTVYVPRGFTSRARQNQQVNVNVRDDGRLGVSDTSGDWSQVWDRAEGVEFDELVLCELARLVEARERDKSGKYKHWDDWDRLCICGHRLGAHAAEKVAGERPCFYGDEHPDEFCDCDVFRPQKKQAR